MWWSILGILTLGYIIYEQIRYQQKKAGRHGPTWIPPIIGMVHRAKDPKFSVYEKSWQEKISVTSILGLFIVTISDVGMIKKMFNNPKFKLMGPPSLPKIIGEDSFVFMHGKEHNLYRKELNPLFTRKTVANYCQLQEKIYDKHITGWLMDGSNPKAYMSLVREMNIESSISVFCGNYLSQNEKDFISREYFKITDSLQLVNIPFALPFTKVWYAIKARESIVKLIEIAITRARLVSKGTCLLDEWIKYSTFTDYKMALTIFTFIFASQDASSSSIIWAMTLLAEHPDVMQKIREEQISIREKKDIEPELLEKMTYTYQVAREILRFRGPVLYVPHSCTEDFDIGGYTIPANAMVLPALYPSSHDEMVFTEPETFNPDRFVNNTSFPPLTFGYGPHICLGREIALNNIAIFIANFSLRVNAERLKTEKGDEISIFSTIYPADGCVLKLREKDD